MATQPVPGTVQVQMQESVDGQAIFQTFYFASVSPWEMGDLQSLADAAASVWDTDFAPLFPAGLTLNRVVVTDLSSLTGDRYVKALSPVSPGTGVGDYLPLNATLAIHLDIGNRGRGKNGRTFWPALLESSVTGDTASTAFGAAAVTAIEALQTACEAINGCHMAIVSRWLDGAKRPNGQEYPVVSVSVRDLSIDSQKDRLPYHKRKKAKSKLPA